jgi:HTH-type transcriptional regulator / antitoxin HigA
MTGRAILVRPIQNEEDYFKALARVEKIFHAARGSDEGVELDALVTLVVAYEEKHFPIDTPDPISMIEFRMDQQGLTRKDLEPFIGSRARVSEIMNGKRSLTLAMIRRLSAGLGIRADVLIGDPEAKPRRRVATVSGRSSAGASRAATRKRTAGAKPTAGKRASAQRSGSGTRSRQRAAGD